ncbi:hypothetical protein CsSME_00044053 [Camellia sinensis var. sinensis]
MEASKVVNNAVQNGSSSDGLPPNPLTGSPSKKSLVRHPSLVKTKMSSISVEPRLSVEGHETKFIPILRSGAWADIGSRSRMEDVYVCVDNFMHDYGVNNFNEEPNAFYGRVCG